MVERVAWPTPKKVAVAVIRVRMIKSILASGCGRLVGCGRMSWTKLELSFQSSAVGECQERSIAEPCVARLTAARWTLYWYQKAQSLLEERAFLLWMAKRTNKVFSVV